MHMVSSSLCGCRWPPLSGRRGTDRLKIADRRLLLGRHCSLQSDLQTVVMHTIPCHGPTACQWNVVTVTVTTWCVATPPVSPGLPRAVLPVLLVTRRAAAPLRLGPGRSYPCLSRTPSYHSFPMISWLGLWCHSQYHTYDIIGMILIMIS
jgi:hypothetical protein